VGHSSHCLIGLGVISSPLSVGIRADRICRVELYPENLFLTLADEPPSAFDEEGQVANVSVNSQVDDRNTQEEGDGVYTEEGDGVYTEEDEGNPKEEGLRVVAVQALFGPFFSMFIERPFNLIYVPHEMCPDQGSFFLPFPFLTNTWY